MGSCLINASVLAHAQSPMEKVIIPILQMRSLRVGEEFASGHMSREW